MDDDVDRVDVTDDWLWVVVVVLLLAFLLALGLAAMALFG